MYAKRIIVFICVFALFIGTGGIGYYCMRINAEESVLEQGNKTLTGQIISENGDSLTVKNDYPVADSFESLGAEAENIVIGLVIKKNASTRNLARNPGNIGQPANDRVVMSQEYEFDIEESLKGNAEGKINIVYPDTTEITEITEISPVSEEMPLIPGRKYLLFLNEGIEGTYYGALEPWQFEIDSDGKVTPKSIIQDEEKVIFKNFYNVSKDEVVEMYKNKYHYRQAE